MSLTFLSNAASRFCSCTANTTSTAMSDRKVGIDDDRVQRLTSSGTLVDKYEFDFLEQCRKPILFVHGEHDEYGNVRSESGNRRRSGAATNQQRHACR